MGHGRTRSRLILGRCASSFSPTATTPTIRRSARLFGLTSGGATPIPATPGSSKPNAATAPGSAASSNADGATAAAPHSARTFVVRAVAGSAGPLDRRGAPQAPPPAPRGEEPLTQWPALGSHERLRRRSDPRRPALL